MDFELEREFHPTTQAELSRFVTENFGGEQRVLYPLGGRTALDYGFPVKTPGIGVSLATLTQIVDYPARDMTVTVEAGIRMDELRRVLADERQQLPIDVPQANRATLGGVIATNSNGPRRYGFGTLRDYLIGLSAVDGQGRVFQAGGRVVKNVAGYDFCKLMIGSLGTLAIITQVTMKVKPLPEATGVLWSNFPAFADVDVVLERLLRSDARPVALSVLNPLAARQIVSETHLQLPCDEPTLVLRVEGAAAETDWQLRTLHRELEAFGPSNMQTVTDADLAALWPALTEFPIAYDAPLTFRTHLLPSRTLEFMELATAADMSVVAEAGNGVVTGHLEESATCQRAADSLQPLRDFAGRTGGQLSLLSCDAAWKHTLQFFGSPQPHWPLMDKLKAAFDPRGLLNRNRYIDGALAARPA